MRQLETPMNSRHLVGILLVQLAICHVACCGAAMPEQLVVGEGFVEPLGFP